MGLGQESDRDGEVVSWEAALSAPGCVAMKCQKALLRLVLKTSGERGASGAVAPELPGGCAGRAGRGRSVGPGAAGSVLMYPASLDDYKGSDVTHILTGTSEIGHIHWDESIHSLE